MNGPQAPPVTPALREKPQDTKGTEFLCLLCFVWFLRLLFRRHQFPEQSRRARMKFSSLGAALATTALAASCSHRGIQGCRASSIFGVQLGAVIGKELNDRVHPQKRRRGVAVWPPGCRWH